MNEINNAKTTEDLKLLVLCLRKPQKYRHLESDGNSNIKLIIIGSNCVLDRKQGPKHPWAKNSKKQGVSSEYKCLLIHRNPLILTKSTTAKLSLVDSDAKMTSYGQLKPPSDQVCDHASIPRQ